MSESTGESGTLKDRLLSLFHKTKDSSIGNSTTKTTTTAPSRMDNVSTAQQRDRDKDLAYQNLIQNIICDKHIEHFKVCISL